MEYKITADARNFIVKFFRNTRNLPMTVEEINDLLKQITPISPSTANLPPAPEQNIKDGN